MEEPTELEPVEALIEEYSVKLSSGSAPSVETFARQHPEQLTELLELLPTIVAMEEIQRRREEASREASAKIPEHVGDFEIVREIGRGGMGIVYEARERTLNRRVALKILPEHSLMNPVRLERFRREAQAAAKLHHTNIVPVFGVGESNGLQYFVMQFIEGRSLHEIVCDQRAANVKNTMEHSRWAARLALQVADALQYAHSQGIQHRDIKPANILVDSKEIAWVADFGLAKAAEHESLTVQGDIVGTLQYMSPETLSGTPDERGDVYSLGLTLYEMLTCRPPYSKTTAAALINEIMTHDPIPPRRIDAGIPQDLETIVLKAAARLPEKRYQTAGEFADDLRRFLEDQPIRARKTSRVERVARWCRHNKGVAVLGSVAAAAIVAALAAGWIGYAQTSAALTREALIAQTAHESELRAQATANMSLQALEAMFEQLKLSDNHDDLQKPWNPNPQHDGGPRRGPPFDPARDSNRRDGNPRLENGETPKPSPTPNDRDTHGRNGPPPLNSMQAEKPTAQAAELIGVIQSVLDFYERFAQKNATNPQLRLESARAYERVGELQMRLDQNVKAEATFERILKSTDELRRYFPNASELPLLEAKAHTRLAGLQDQRENFEAAALHYQKGIQILAALSGTEVKWRGDLGQLRLNYSRVLTRQKKYDEAIAVLIDLVHFHEPDAEKFGPARWVTRTAYLKLSELYGLKDDAERSQWAAGKAEEFNAGTRSGADGRP